MKNIKEIQHALIEAGDAAADGLVTRTSHADPITRTVFESVYNGTATALEYIEDGIDWDAKGEIFELTMATDEIAKVPGVKSFLRRDKNAEIAMHKALHYLWEAAFYAK